MLNEKFCGVAGESYCIQETSEEENLYKRSRQGERERRNRKHLDTDGQTERPEGRERGLATIIIRHTDKKSVK